METREQVLQKCTVEGTVVKLPAGQLERKLYVEVAKSLELIGGKWKGNKVMGFVFPTDPTELLEQIANGEKRNLKKEFQFFGTSDSLSDDIVFEAQIEPFHKILEPSAGQGAIIKAVHRVFEMNVDYCELMPVNQTFLKKIPNTTFIAEDFLTLKGKNIYDRIVMNPPFSGNQDILHVKAAYDLLKKGGRLVSITSRHYILSSNKKETEFMNWLKEIKADIRLIDAGAFKESGTGISTVMLIINK